METKTWTNKTIKYGWKKDKVNPNDVYHKFSLSRSLESITFIDLREKCPPIYDQGNLGSCTANAIAAAYEFDEIKDQNLNEFIPSRLFIYYNEREIEGD